MSKYTTDELNDVILHVANSLKNLADGFDTFNKVLKELTYAMENMNQMILYLPDEILKRTKNVDLKK